MSGDEARAAKWLEESELELAKPLGLSGPGESTAWWAEDAPGVPESLAALLAAVRAEEREACEAAVGDLAADAEFLGLDVSLLDKASGAIRARKP